MDNISNTVMSVFKDFGADKLPNIKLTKIGCVDGRFPKVPNGQIVKGVFMAESESRRII